VYARFVTHFNFWDNIILNGKLTHFICYFIITVLKSKYFSDAGAISREITTWKYTN